MCVKGTLFLALSLVASLGWATEECSHLASARRAFAANKIVAAPKLFESPAESDVQSLNLDLEIFPSTKIISGVATQVVTAKKVGGLNEFAFRLASDFTIASATVDGTPITVTRIDSINLKATLPRGYAYGENFTIAITYSGTPTSAQGFGSAKIGYRTGTTPYFETLSEPYYAYTWWPNKEDNSDKFTSTVSVTAPNTMVSVSNGLLQSTTPLSGSRNKMTWKTNYQTTPYLVSVGSSNYNLYLKTWNYGTTSMPVNFYIWPEQDTTSTHNQCDLVLSMLTAFSNRFGIYPFSNEKYCIYQFTFGGGMEHQTCTGQINFSESLSSHELGHQWWGDNITCKKWEDIWLNEGFATYCEAVWLETKPGSTGFPALRTAMNARRPSTVNGTVYRTNTSSVNSIFDSNFSYKKGGWVLHMLRKVMGETAFWQGMTNYRAAFQGSTADTTDFKNVMSTAYGSDLSWFFDEWIYQAGAPNITMGTSPKTLNGKNYLAVSLTQTQTNTAPWPTAYKMPLEFRYTDGTAQSKTLWNYARNQWYLIPTTNAATAPSLDADDWVLIPTKSTGTYVAGPPKVLEVIAGTGTIAGSTTFVFSSPVNVTGSKITLTSGGVAKRFLYAMDSTKTRLTVMINDRSAVAFQISLLDTITGADTGLALDGENVAFPSGDGVPGGAYVYTVRRGISPS